MSLTATQIALLQAHPSEVSILLRFDTNNDGTYDYNYSTKSKTFDSVEYLGKITGLDPLDIKKGNPESNLLPSSKITIKVSNPDSTLSPDDYKGGTVRIALVIKATLLGVETEAECLAWRFIVTDGASVNQMLQLTCVDWFSRYLEGDYPNTPLVPDLFPSKSMKADNYCVPLTFGQPYIPLRYVIKWQDGTYVDADTFTVAGDQTALFCADQYIWANLGIDGYVNCWVDSSSVGGGDDIFPAGDMETDPENEWTASSVTLANEAVIIHGGSQSLKIIDGGGYGYKNFTTVIGRDYRVTVYVYNVDDALVRGHAKAYDGDTLLGSDSSSSSGEWEEITFDFVATNTTTQLRLYPEAWGGTISYFDDVTVEEIVTTVNLTAASGSLTANLTRVATDGYVLGSNTPTYTINRACVPRAKGWTKTYLPATYTFRQVTFEGSDGEDYKICQLLGQDKNDDGTNDAVDFWQEGKDFLDAPFRFTRDDTVNETSPEEVFEYVAEDLGIPSDQIDDTALSAAATTYAARSLTFDIGIYYTMPRKEFFCKLLTLGNAVILPMDKLYYKVLDPDSQGTLTKGMVKKGTFKITPKPYTPNSQKDSGYFVWQESTEPIDQVNRSIVAAKSSTSKKSDVTIDADWILDSQKAKKASQLALQRRLLPDKNVTFVASSDILIYQPGDMLTVSEDDYGADGGSILFQIESFRIIFNRVDGLLVDVRGVTFSDTLDDWGDLSASAITIEDTDESRANQTVNQGVVDALDSDDKANVVKDTVRLKAGADLILESSDSDPAITRYQGTSYAVEVGGDADGDRFSIKANTANVIDFFIGNQAWWGSGGMFKNISLWAKDGIILSCGDIDNTDNGGIIYCYETQVEIFSQDGAGNWQSYTYDHNKFGVSRDNYSDIGDATHTIKDIHSQKIITYNTSAPIVVAPNVSADAPTHSAGKGTLYSTSAGVLYINTDGGTTWDKVGGQ